MFVALFLSFIGCQDYSLRERPDLSLTDTDPVVEGDKPIALCEVMPATVAPIREAATFDGSTSYDPEGQAIISYEWTLVEVPPGSNEIMPDGDAVRSFTPQQAGIYVAKLVVTNAGFVQSDPCEVTLEGVPPEAMWVEMYWTLPGDDMDLHLLAPGGAPLSNLDCYYANCDDGDVLDWGQPGVAVDNPALDLDDISGTGPENINIESPDASQGGYTVMVYDFGGGRPAPNDVTVNVYIDGALVQSATRTITGDLSENYFFQIDMASGSVTPL